LPSAFAALRDSGIVELATTAVTHGFLPALEQMPGAVDRQIEAGIAAHGAAFGATPMGFWLPECGWFTGVDRLLRSQGIEWTVVDSHAVALATPPPEQGIHAPCCTESGLVLFARDRESARQVWDAEHGYPGNGEYRDFHLDAGDWMTEASVEAVLPEGRRRPTGVKIHRVTDRAGGPKELYRPSRAMKQAATDALHFLHSRAADAVRLRQSPTVRSGMLCAFDAELFGHWWHEGTVWLEAVLRESAWFAPGMRLASPGAIVRNGGVLQILEPSPSSWGEGGYARSWLNPRVAEVYPELHRATLRLEEWYREVPPALAHDAALRKRVWLQLQTELFLAQSSDWPFLIHRGTAPEYAAMRISDHLDAFERLSNLSRSCGPEMVAFLESREQKYPEFYHAP
jgi:1,4-alpha-glucan branching enzyme